MAWVRARLCKLQKGGTRLAAASDKVYQLFGHGLWFSSSTTNTGRHDIAESGVKHKKKSESVSFLIFPLQPRHITHKIHFVFSEIFRLIQWIFCWNSVYIWYFPCSTTTVMWYKLKAFVKYKNISLPYDVILYRPTNTVCYELKGCIHFTVSKLLSKT